MIRLSTYLGMVAAVLVLNCFPLLLVWTIKALIPLFHSTP